MCKSLLSVGLDVGTTTTQLIVSRLQVENRASAFAVPEMEIAQRQVLYRSGIYFTPLLGQELVDGEGIREIVEREYAAAGIRRQDVDTGAIIITGETSRRENAAAVLEALSAYAGDFVVATAGPDLESVLAAKGAGAVAYSEETGKSVLHIDIGGGTSNFALVQQGEVTATACLNVGGRLIKTDEAGRIRYISPVLEGLTELQLGQIPTQSQREALAELLAQALEMAAGLRQRTALLDTLQTAGSSKLWEKLPCRPVISFSGGVADCIEKRHEPGAFGDIGTELGAAIRESALCRGEYRLGSETIRATVIGAGCHSARLSGSTVYSAHVTFPLKNLPVAALKAPVPDTETMGQALSRLEGDGILAFPGVCAPKYTLLKQLAEAVAAAFEEKPVRIAMEADMALALGQRLALLLPEREILCIDRVRLEQGSYLDVGAPAGPALPVVIKTLILEK
ncbi:MAG: ethanolamine ammonia-lyase reactivating factor EutA [Oscillospiraceae bacterium]|nr:ethanolamine ammonia-lyase reactivating factor EutA [Oscillospiraceae bacterium]